MTKRSTTCLPCSRQAGLTLIEVVAAIAILGTILVSVVIAKSRHTRQVATAERRAVAVRLADKMLTQWWASETGLPYPASGKVEGDSTLTWDTRVVGNDILGPLGARVVRFQMHDARPTTVTHASHEEPLVIVDLVLSYETSYTRSTKLSEGGAR